MNSFFAFIPHEAHYRRVKAGKPKRHSKAIWAVANRICRLVWKVLHDGVSRAFARRAVRKHGGSPKGLPHITSVRTTSSRGQGRPAS